MANPIKWDAEARRYWYWCGKTKQYITLVGTSGQPDETEETTQDDERTTDLQPV